MKHLLLVLMIALAGNAWAGSEGTIGTTLPNKATVMGADNGTVLRPLSVNPATDRLRTELPTPGTFFGAGIAGDTTQAKGTITGQYMDTDSAPWTTANLYPHKAILINITTLASAAGGTSVCFRIQGSNTGAFNDWQNIIIPKINAGVALAAAETLQFVSENTGAPFLSPTVYAGAVSSLNTIPLDAVSTTASGLVYQPLNQYAMLRVVAMNRTDKELTYTVRWIGSQ
jgi:hypothetical protein